MLRLFKPTDKTKGNYILNFFFLYSAVLSACQGAENAGRRLGEKLAEHPFSPRTRRLEATSLRSCAWLRLRGFPSLRFGAFLDNHKIAFGCESVTAAPPSSRRPPCFPAFPAVARGALSLQLKRSADIALRFCRKMRHSLANARHLV